MMDLLINLFIPIRRFRCGAMDCDWEGNMRISRTERDADRQ